MFSSTRVKEGSFELCDNDDDNEDKDEDEELLCNPIGYTLLRCLGKNSWFNFLDSWTLLVVLFSIACLLAFAFEFALDMLGKI